MSIFDMFDGNEPTESKQSSNDGGTWTKEKRKAVGQRREDAAIARIRERVTNGDHLLQGLHFIEPVSEEICETDGIYVCGNTIHVVEIKSKNFDYLYGNTDTGYWYLTYKDKTVKSDNVFRQISRQMRILMENTERHFHVVGHIFINNTSPNVVMDIVGTMQDDITLHTDVDELCALLNTDSTKNPGLVTYLADLDKYNKSLIPADWT